MLRRVFVWHFLVTYGQIFVDTARHFRITGCPATRATKDKKNPMSSCQLLTSMIYMGVKPILSFNNLYFNNQTNLKNWVTLTLFDDISWNHLTVVVVESGQVLWGRLFDWSGSCIVLIICQAALFITGHWLWRDLPICLLSGSHCKLLRHCELIGINVNH